MYIYTFTSKRGRIYVCSEVTNSCTDININVSQPCSPQADDLGFRV